MDEENLGDVTEWLSGGSVTNTATKPPPNVTLISTAESAVSQFTTLIAEPVTSPFSLDSSDFLLSDAKPTGQNDSESRVSLGQSPIILSVENERESGNWMANIGNHSNNLTLNTSKTLFSIIFIPSRGAAFGRLGPPNPGLDIYFYHYLWSGM